MKRIRAALFIALLMVTFAASCIYNMLSVPDISESAGSIAADSKGSFYALGNTDTRVSFMRVNNSGVIDCYYSARRNTADNMLLFGDIFADEDANRVYTVRNVLDNRSNRFTSSSIVYFDTSLKEARPETLYELGLDTRDPDGGRFIRYIDPRGGYLYFTTVSEDLKDVALYRFYTGKPPGDKPAAPELLVDCRLPGGSSVNAALCGEDFVIVQTMDSNIYRIDLQGTSTLIFPTKEYTGRCFPMNLCLDNEGRLHFHEIFSRDAIVMDAGSGRVLSVRKGETPVYSGSSYLQRDVSMLSAYDEGTGAVIVSTGPDGSSLPIVLHGGTARELRNPRLSRDVLLINSLETSLTALAVILPLLALILLFRFAYRRRPTLLMKLVVFVLPIVVAALFIYSQVATRIFDRSITEERTGLVKNVGGFVVQNVDTALLSQINSPRDMRLPAYDRLLRSISKVTDYSSFLPADPEYVGLYCMLMRVEKGRIYTAVSADMPCFVPLDSLYSEQSMELYRIALSGRNMVTGTIKDVQGIWTVAIYPVFDAEGEITGMLETGINSKDLEASMLSLSRMMLLAGAAVCLAVLLAFFIALKALLHPLALLKAAVVAVYNGKYGALAKIKANDEVADIGRVFNKLSLELNSQFGKLTSLNKAYSKLVPPDTFLLLKKNSVLDIKLGDQISTKMTIMNAFIRNFEKIASDLTPDTTFKLINRIYKIISSNSADHSGVVQSYNADKLTVMFQNNPENALKSVICIRSELSSESGSLFAKSWHMMDAGFYIHTAPCIYGIAGDENRYSPAVVTEDNDILYTLDSLQHQLMCPILVTQDAYDGLADPDGYNHRYIGYMTGGDSRTKTELYEFFDGDAPDVLAGKKQALELFGSAVSGYMEQDFYKARNLFAQVVKANAKDTVARWFLFKCDMLCKQADGPPPELALAKYL